MALAGAATLAWRNWILDTPTYASDEYAYLALGKFYHDHDELFRNDPWLQHLSNLLYFRVVHAAFVATTDGYAALKILNVLLYSLAGFTLASLLRHLTNVRASCLFLALYFVLPWSGFTASMQPEVLAYFCVIMTLLCAVTAAVRQSLLGCGVAGFLTATAFYIKPNVIGLGIGTALFFLFSFGDGATGVERVRMRLYATSCFIGSAYGALIAWPCLMGETLRWIPALGSHYVGQLAAPTGGKLQTIAQVLKYSGGHVAVLLMLFPTGLAGVIDVLWRRSADRTEANTQEQRLVLCLARWFALVVPASIVAVAYYSAKSGVGDPLGIRLHGRYLGFMLPLLLLFVFVHRTRAGSKDATAPSRARLRFAAVLLFLGLVLWFTFIERQFRIYPWDSPELSALYSKANNYWHEPALWSSRLPMLLAASALVFLLATGRAWSSYAAVVYLAVWMATGNRNNTAFQSATKVALGQLTVDARALRKAGATSGRGVVICADRHLVSYALFGVASKPAVLMKAEGTEILPSDIPTRTQWVLCVGDFVPRFEYSSRQTKGSLNLFLLTPRTVQ